MNSEFYTYFQLGLQHIADLNAYDHILFIVALCAIYRPEDWKKVLILVTAFTIGHSLTLAMAALDLIRFRQELIEFLIPVTILFTAALNLLPGAEKSRQHMPLWKYLLPLVFGFIHGMGFSNYFKSLLGKEESVVKPLFAFNLGIEAGQIGIVVALMILSFLVMGLARIKQPVWTRLVSGIAAVMALFLMWETKFW
ncbi:MAG TPA: HupE/UreJ family protein [Saprospiraceae bacterium]|nr:HupE/UreJ family protein [Saprospiraceae bacterium]HNT22176.1 HupE/UreJ family protein [Saprospiraceae bacterium]